MLSEYLYPVLNGAVLLCAAARQQPGFQDKNKQTQGIMLVSAKNTHFFFWLVRFGWIFFFIQGRLNRNSNGSGHPECGLFIGLRNDNDHQRLLNAWGCECER